MPRFGQRRRCRARFRRRLANSSACRFDSASKPPNAGADGGFDARGECRRRRAGESSLSLSTASSVEPSSASALHRFARPRTIELVVRAFERAVVELAAAVGFLADELLRVAPRRENVVRPRRQPPQHERKRPVERLDLGIVAHPLAVGRIGDDAAVLGLGPQLGERPLLQMDVLRDAGLLGVVAGEAQRFGIDVVRQEPLLERRPHEIAGFLAARAAKASRRSVGHASAAKSRFSPGAMLRPRSAASIGIVPVPQNGSASTRPAARS